MNDFYSFFRIFWTLFSEYSLTSFSASDTSVSIVCSSFSAEILYRSECAFSFRRIVRNALNSYSHAEDLKTWANQINLKLRSLISFMKARIEILKLLWQYRHLNNEDFSDLFSTDLIIHRVQLQSRTKSSSKSQRKMTAHKKWWFKKLIQEDLENDVYEYCETVNERFSSWNAQAIMMNKSNDSKSTDEMRMTFDYSRIDEIMSETYIELSLKMHDHLSDSKHEMLMSADMKHAYFIINLHFDDRHIFAFIISEIDQLQFIRMQQEFMSAKFILIEMIYKALDFISFSNFESFLLHFSDSSILSSLSTYMNDIFEEFRIFENMFSFLRDHFFSRIEWIRLKLFFKKLKLFMNQIKTLNVVHVVEDRVFIVSERIKKIAKWSTSINFIEVKTFLEVVDITKRWMKNFTEIAKSLSRLTEKTDWKWAASENLFFEILKIKCFVHISMNEINLALIFHFYCDAFEYAAELTITQIQMKHLKNSKLITENDFEEISIVYDSFVFNKIQRKYSIYKKKLCVIVKFAVKYDYLCKHSNNTIIIHIDHRSLTHFLFSNSHEEIYDHWADQLRRLNVVIFYISEFRNKVADEFFRILFRAEDCDSNNRIEDALVRFRNQKSSWVWKNERDEYQSFLDTLNQTDLEEIIIKSTIQKCSVFVLEIDFNIDLKKISWKKAYYDSEWFEDVYRFLENETMSENFKNIVFKFYDYKIYSDTEILWIHRTREEEMFLSCIFEKKVLSVLRKTHDEDDHWAKTTTLIKFRDMTYWSHQIKNVKRYIDECLICARHESAIRSQFLNSIHVFQSFQLTDLNFIDALFKTSKRNSFILHFMNYFSRFSVIVIISTANVEDVISTLKHIFNAYQKSIEIYCDESQHFFNEELKEWLRSQRIKLTLSFSESSQSTELIEDENKFLEAILRKDSNKEWNLILNRFTNRLNSRIIEHLELSSTDILMKPRSSVFAMNSILLFLSNMSHSKEIIHQLNQSLIHREVVRVYIIYRAQIHDRIRQLFKKQKEKEVEKFNREITKQIVHQIESLVMLYQKKHIKLASRWRDLFRIFEYEDTHQLSFILNQLNDRKIRETFHENHLKIFKSRTEYFSDSFREEDLLQYQTIRMSKSKKKRI